MPADFLKVECEECGNQQNIFSKPATDVECLVCGEVIAAANGGTAIINGEVLQTLEAE